AAVKLKERFPNLALKGTLFKGDTQILVPKASLLEVVNFLKEESGLNYNMLSDITAVDYLNYPGAAKAGRFGIVYIFNSIPMTPGKEGSPRLILRVFVDEADIEVESLVPIYAGAE